MRMSEIAAESLRKRGIGRREFSGARETRDTCYTQRRAECSR
jgi:hypothetical protein